MTAFPRPLRSRAIPLQVDNVDTDTIIPSREMRTTGRTGLADGLFAPWRYVDADARVENPEFAFNRPEFRDAAILVGGANFGCGSSREHAVWALAEWGIRAILAESFAPIFRANCIRNFVLPATLAAGDLRLLAGHEVTIDLAAQTIAAAGREWAFAIDGEAKAMLAQGLDAIDLTLEREDTIEAWTKTDRAARPWIYFDGRKTSSASGKAQR